ncbi:hypothetical protein NUW58_g8184 [Xylaria curta]|uniref:Uncharacterized protein n=1 Tax=Xylaria curta TaxID=42375 RepID=A0ACC1NC90_9PEZI|nr:hypothetical protein NUW58_g8184 [Xylaria curta]
MVPKGAIFSTTPARIKPASWKLGLFCTGGSNQRCISVREPSLFPPPRLRPADELEWRCGLEKRDRVGLGCDEDMAGVLLWRGLLGSEPPFTAAPARARYSLAKQAPFNAKTAADG